MLKRLGQQTGITLSEVMVTVLILTLTSAILIPKMTGSTDSVNDQQAINTLDTAWETAGEYYQGNRGIGNTQGAPDQYTGFSPQTAWRINGKLVWMNSTYTNNAPATNFPLTPSKTTADKVYIAEVASTSTDDATGNAGQELGLCAASALIVICKYDDGKAGYASSLGPRYGASLTTQAQALTRAKDTTSPTLSCTVSANKARLFALNGHC
jgi:Tfp pilus assembly protein PilE